MSLYVSPVRTHASTDYHPPGITGDEWCYMVSTESLLDLGLFVTTNILTIGQLVTSIRTPALGSLLTYIGLTAAGRTAALAAGALAAPSEGLCRAQGFDAPIGLWEPA